MGYTWEESGPSLAARRGEETIEQHVEKLSSLPFVDVLYIRCDWRDVQSRAGKLDLHPIWKLTFDVTKRLGLRVAFRVQLSNRKFSPLRLRCRIFCTIRCLWPRSVNSGATAGISMPSSPAMIIRNFRKHFVI